MTRGSPIPDSEIRARRARPGDAEAIRSCFLACYGDTYPGRHFYDPARLAQAIESRSLRPIVATRGDSVVGHLAMTIVHPEARAPEVGNTVVLPEERGSGVLASMGRRLNEALVEDGFSAYVHYPTTAHTIMQKRSVSRGGVETGVMLDFVPAATDYRGFERQSRRLAATIVYQPVAPVSTAAEITLPRRYEKLLRGLLSALPLRRDPVIDGVSGMEPAVELEAETEPALDLLHVSVRRLGADFDDALDALLRTVSVCVAHVDLPLAPGIDGAVEVLVARGFFFCGLLPDFGMGDVLRMQRLFDADEGSFAPQLANPGARALAQVMRSERD